MLRIWLFGGVRFQIDDGEPKVPTREPARRLLAYLALQPGLQIDKEIAATAIWGAGDTSASFRGALSALNAAFREAGAAREDYIATVAGIKGGPEGTIELRDRSADGTKPWIDAARFDALEHEQREAAVAIASGRFLADLNLNPGTWLGQQREAYERRVAEARARIPPTAPGPSTAAAPDDGPATSRALGRQRLLAWVGIAALATALVGIAALIVFQGGGSSAGTSAKPSPCPAGLTQPSAGDRRAEQVSATSGTATALRPIVTRSRPRSLVVASDGVWVAQSTDASLGRIDPRQGFLVGEPIALGGRPWSVAVAKDRFWVTREDGVLVEVDRATREVARRIRYGRSAGEVTLGAGSVWVNNYGDQYSGRVTRIDPCSRQPPRRIRVGRSANTVKFAFGAIWVTDSEQNAVFRVDPRDNSVTRIDLRLSDPQDIGAGAGFIWVAHYGPKRLQRIDPRTRMLVGAPIPIGPGPGGVAVGAGAVWLPNYESTTVTRVDLGSLKSNPRAVTIEGSPTDVAIGHGRVWVTNIDAEPPSVSPIRP